MDIPKIYKIRFALWTDIYEARHSEDQNNRQ
jgi:hypothetical protein